jgi:hypothetical protein
MHLESELVHCTWARRYFLFWESADLAVLTLGVVDSLGAAPITLRRTYRDIQAGLGVLLPSFGGGNLAACFTPERLLPGQIGTAELAVISEVRTVARCLVISAFLCWQPTLCDAQLQSAIG